VGLLETKLLNFLEGLPPSPSVIYSSRSLGKFFLGRAENEDFLGIVSAGTIAFGEEQANFGGFWWLREILAI
jgi:hypothetical protein